MTINNSKHNDNDNKHTNNHKQTNNNVTATSGRLRTQRHAALAPMVSHLPHCQMQTTLCLSNI